MHPIRGGGHVGATLVVAGLIEANIPVVLGSTD